MVTSRLKFPQISRFFSATVGNSASRLGLWGSLTALVLFNFFSAVNSPLLSAQPAVVRVLLAPYDPTNHLALANWLWQAGWWAAAKQELLLASEFWKSPAAGNDRFVLGTTASPTDLLHEWEEEPHRLSAAYAYWQGVAKEKPDYRDAYVAAAAAAYQLGNMGEAQNLLHQALTIDGTLAVARDLLTLVSQHK